MPRTTLTPKPRPEQILILVKTYPTPSLRDIEVSCTAGVTSDGKLIRIFPVPFRFMKDDQRFKKYQEIRGQIWKSNDVRPESHKIEPDSIEIVGPPIPSDNKWEARRKRIEHLEEHCMCCLRKKQLKSGFPTLGFFRPHEVDRLLVKETSAEWSERERAKLGRVSLWNDREVAELEKIPHTFKYRYKCPHEYCPGHEQSCTDWEMAQSFRGWRWRYGEDWEAKFREKYEDHLIENCDLSFFVGTDYRYGNWLVVGLWYPLKGPRNPMLL